MVNNLRAVKMMIIKRIVIKMGYVAKYNVIFCDERHNPIAEMQPLYGSFNTSKKIKQQIQWNENMKKSLWSIVIEEKIKKQAKSLFQFFFWKKFWKKTGK
ncbi:MAG: hypothetical protein ACRC6K_00365 [Fusobacteriaceae bacterium]